MPGSEGDGARDHMPCVWRERHGPPMTQRIGNVVVIEDEPDKRCELCGEVTDCRPAGPNGEQVCHPCALKDPAAMDRYAQRLFQGSVTQ